MSRQIFRQSALERLASPEQLDRPYRLVRLPAWIILGILVVAMSAAAAWAFVTQAPVKVESRGIVLQRGGLLEIVADAPGRIDQLLLEPGQMVSAEQVVARFQRSELERELGRERAELADARNRLAELEAFYAESAERERHAEEARLQTISETRSFVERRRELVERKLQAITKLVEQRVVVNDRLLEAELELTNARERLSGLDDEAKVIALRRLERESKHRLAIIDEKLKASQLEHRVARTQARLEQDRVAKSAHSGLVVEIKVNRGDVVAAGTPIATLMGAGETEEIFGLLYVAPVDGKRVQPGMTVEVTPSTVRRVEYGFIVGKVTSVSPIPATIEGMRSVLKNEQLVTQLSGTGAPFEVRVSFLKDTSTGSGLKWSSSRGPAGALHASTLLDAKIVVDRIPLINLVIPGMSPLTAQANE